MGFIGIMAGIGIIGSWIAITKRNYLYAIGTSIAWFIIISYTRSNPIAGIALGSGTDSLLIGICVSFSVGTILSIFFINESEKKKNNPPPDEHDVNRHNSKGSSYESAEDYQKKLYDMTHRKKN